MTDQELNRTVNAMANIAEAQISTSDVTFEMAITAMSDDVLHNVLLNSETIIRFLERAKLEATRRAVCDGKQYAGFKLRKGSKRRFFVNDEAVAKILEQHGVNPWAPKKLRTLREIETEIGTAAFKELEPYVSETESEPSLVAVRKEAR